MRPKVKPGRIYQSLAPLVRDTGEQKNEKRLSFVTVNSNNMEKRHMEEYIRGITVCIY